MIALVYSVILICGSIIRKNQ